MNENTIRRDTVDLLKLIKYGIEKGTNPMPLLDQLIDELPRAHKSSLAQARLAAIDECIAACNDDAGEPLLWASKQMEALKESTQ